MNYAVAKLLFCFTSQSLLTISIATLEANTNIKTNLQGKFRSERIRKYCLYSVRLEIWSKWIFVHDLAKVLNSSAQESR